MPAFYSMEIIMRELNSSELQAVSGGELPAWTSIKDWFDKLITSAKDVNEHITWGVSVSVAGSILNIAKFFLGRFLH